MEILEQYDNVRIIKRDEQVIPAYELTDYSFTDTEKSVLDHADKLLTEIELDAIRKQPEVGARKEVIKDYLDAKIPKTKNKDQLIRSIMNRVLGYGELSPLVDDINLEEIMVNGVNIPVFVFHRKYGMCMTNVLFTDKTDIFRIINRLCWIHNKELKPIIDLATIDGSRANITLDPISIHGPAITLRKQKGHLFTVVELIELGTMDVNLAALLWLAVDGMRLCPANLLVCGSIGSGKTTTLNALTMLSPPEERIITIEETPEMRLDGKENWIPLTCYGEYDMDSLVRNTLRMRPDKIIIGEIRGKEAIALFNAMNVGHKGLGTLHSSSSREAIYRLQSQPMNVPTRIIANLDLIVIQNIFHYHGRPIRRITEVSEVGGMEGDTVLLGSIYEWDPMRDKVAKDDTVAPTTFLDKLAIKIRAKKKDIVAELDRRRMVLNTLLEHKIHNHDDVLRAINTFYREEQDFDNAIMGIKQ
ncbi:MAG: CpaF family protein [Candidatus Altiarchaeota archaeon]|nr:CpaF family protein [Candidatus Altiarchaeota archaeon]